ncbi:uncharacterized protein LOC128956900 [Oppia nitens]|uniref:uncharacterized protein LOC128956900 n=1 Tax=Oppia nitens TaxID=1686743 RepID=UPI0023DBB0D3|nr:uncharacterized protein LOC128956900 [Oppia nitens]
MTKKERPLKCLKYVAYGLCIVCVVSLIVVLALQTPPSNQSPNSVYLLYTEMNRKTFTGLLVTFGVIGIVVQLIAMFGIFKQHYWSLIGYSIVTSIMAGLCLAAAIIGQIGLSSYNSNSIGSYAGVWYLTVLLFVCSATTSSLAKRLRQLAKSTSTIVYVDPMTNQNVIYQVPSGRTTYLVPGGQQQQQLQAPGGDGTSSLPVNQPIGSYGPYHQQQQQRQSPTGVPDHQPFGGFPVGYGQHPGMIINPAIGQQYGEAGPSSSSSAAYIGGHGYGYPPPHVMPNEAPPSYEPPGVSSPHYNTNPTNNDNNTDDNTNRPEEVFVPPVVSSGKTMPPEPHWRS